MRLRPQKPPFFPRLLCGTGIIVLIAATLLSSRGGVASLSNLSDLGSTSNTLSVDAGDNHQGDAQLACDAVTRWLTDSPGTATVTIPRRELLWVQTLTDSAARQAKAVQKPLELPRRMKRPGRQNVSTNH